MASSTLSHALTVAERNMSDSLVEAGMAEYKMMISSGSSSDDYVSSLRRLSECFKQLSEHEDLGSATRTTKMDLARRQLTEAIQSSSDDNKFGLRRKLHQELQHVAPPSDSMVWVPSVEATLPNPVKSNATRRTKKGV